MNIQVQKLIKKREGISLVVLIVTIIIMIILAGAVILSVAVNNPIPNAKEAMEKNNLSALKEAANVIASSIYTEENGNIKFDLQSEVQDKLNSLNKFDDKQIKRVKVTSNGYVSIDVDKVIVADKPELYYGKYVNYIAEDEEINNCNIKWKIFHSDGNNIFLISDNYIPYDIVPYSNKNGEKTFNKPASSGYCKVNFLKVENDYSGLKDIIDERIRKLNRDYFEKKYKTNSTNMKCVAYMLDTLAWNSFKNDKAEYAIGGPTLQLFCESYNRNYDRQIEIGVVSEIGYSLKWSDSDNDYGVVISNLEISDLYSVSSDTTAEGMWLATPNSKGGIFLMHVKGNQIFWASHGVPYNGFRPVICLKSDTLLYEKEDGTYDIYSPK